MVVSHTTIYVLKHEVNIYGHIWGGSGEATQLVEHLPKWAGGQSLTQHEPIPVISAHPRYRQEDQKFMATEVI